jgi:hypothetical protein
LVHENFLPLYELVCCKTPGAAFYRLYIRK